MSLRSHLWDRMGASPPPPLNAVVSSTLSCQDRCCRCFPRVRVRLRKHLSHACSMKLQLQHQHLVRLQPYRKPEATAQHLGFSTCETCLQSICVAPVNPLLLLFTLQSHRLFRAPEIPHNARRKFALKASIGCFALRGAAFPARMQPG